MMSHSKSWTTIMVRMCFSLRGTSSSLWFIAVSICGIYGPRVVQKVVPVAARHVVHIVHATIEPIMDGWMEVQCFNDWFYSVFHPHSIKIEGRKVLIGNNLSPHFSDELLSTCESVSLPTNSTYIILSTLEHFFLSSFEDGLKVQTLRMENKKSMSKSHPKEYVSISP